MQAGSFTLRSLLAEEDGYDSVEYSVCVAGLVAAIAATLHVFGVGPGQAVSRLRPR